MGETYFGSLKQFDTPAEDKMATRCTCSRKNWLEPWQHDRHCPESAERVRIEELELALRTAVRDKDITNHKFDHLRARISCLGPGLLDYIDGKEDPRIKEMEEALKESQSIIQEMHNIIAKYVSS